MKTWLVAALVVLLAACTQRICDPGETQGCLCADLSMSAQICAEDGARWMICQCGGIDPFDAGPGRDGALPGTDSGPPGPTVTCSPPGSRDVAVLDEPIDPAAVPTAELEYFPGGALARLDGVDCTLAADQTNTAPSLCFDRYTCGACTIEIQYWPEGIARQFMGDCPTYHGSYALCEQTYTCAGRNCGEDSCGQTCGAGTCSSGLSCVDGICGTPPCPSGCMQGSVCCGPPFCSGDCVGTPCC